MENKLAEILELALINSPNNFDTRAELLFVLENNGGAHFFEIKTENRGVIFTTNEFGILSGIGFDKFGDFKVWNNSKFGTFKI